nr:hypothetical protein [Tanacetum cinerariifolium]
MKVRKEKRSDSLVDEEDEEPQPASELQVEDDEYNLQIGLTQRLPDAEGKGKGTTTDEQDDTSANVVRDTPSPTYAETDADTEKLNSKGDTEIINVDEERGENVLNMAALEDITIELDKGQARSYTGKTPESRPPFKENKAESNPGQSHVVLAGQNPEPMHEDFVATIYPQNLDDAFTFGGQFLNDKPTEEEPGKANMETEVKSMVTIPINQDSSSAPPLSTPIIDLKPPKPVSPPAQEPIFTYITVTRTTTLLPPPPPQQQSTTIPELVIRVSALENICVNFKKKHKLQDKPTQALSSRMFESGSYKSQPEHAAFYDVLETSDIRETSSSSSKQKTAPQSKQHVNDVPIPDDVHILDSEDTSDAYLLKIKTRPDWLKPVPKEDRPKTPKPDWAVPSNDLPETENNYANAIANAYKYPEENKLIWKTGDMGSFIK